MNVAKSSLLLISRDSRKGLPVDKLFVEIDRTQAVRERLPDYRKLWDEVQEATMDAEPPVAALNGFCRSCEFFDFACLGRDITNPLHQLPRFSADRIEELGSQGIQEIADIDDDVPLSEVQARVRDSVRTGSEFIGDSLRDDLNGVQWPAYYLDFESVMTVLPLYPGLAPFEQVLTQFSIHRCSALGQIDHHSEFLADHTRDCRRELAERLISELGENGSIIVYSSFELTRINELAELFPDLKPKLDTIAGRLFDLLPVIRRGYYHPEFFGSFSIKTVLPVLVPDLSYDGLAINDGGAAIAQFARLAMGQIDGEDAVTIRRNLLEYCYLDTLAMVRLHEQLWRRGESAVSQR